jgi:predicted transcriptional regulator
MSNNGGIQGGEGDFFWDYISVMDRKEAEASIKDLFQDAFKFIELFVQELFWIDQNFLYLNLVCNVPQTKIASMFGVSQLAVSKRVRSAVKKLRMIISKPESDSQVLRNNLSLLLPSGMVEIMMVYYRFGTYSITSKIVDKSGNNIKSVVNQSQKWLEKISKVNSKFELENVLFRIHKSKMTVKNIMDTVSDVEDFKYKAKQYHEFYSMQMNQNNYSTYSWKKFDDQRNLSQQPKG